MYRVLFCSVSSVHNHIAVNHGCGSRLLCFPPGCLSTFSPAVAFAVFSACIVHGVVDVMDMIRSLAKSNDHEVKSFLKLHRSGAWFLSPESGCGVLVDKVPLDPVCIEYSAREKHVHFDMSLTDCVVGDPEYLSLRDKLQGEQHCSLISASGSGKTKAVMDFMKVRLAVLVATDGLHCQVAGVTLLELVLV